MDMLDAIIIVLGVSAAVGGWRPPRPAQPPNGRPERPRARRAGGFTQNPSRKPPDTPRAWRGVRGPGVLEGSGPAPALGPPPAETGLSQARANEVARST